MKTLLFFFLVSTVYANPPSSKSQFCQQAAMPGFFVGLSFEPENRMSFRNQGGFLGGGVCWWHSLLQRSAFYLSVFNPELPKPTKAQAQQIVLALASQKYVVEIPGYANFNEFTKDWQNVIQRILNRWQLADGFLRQKWLDHIFKPVSYNPEKFEKQMKAIAYQVQSNRITWTMLKLEGFIVAHAWLITEAIPEIDGIAFTYIDSNYPGKTLKQKYTYGSKTLPTRYGNTAPYLGRTSDFERIDYAIQNYCTNGIEASQMPHLTIEDLNNSFN